MKRFVTEEVHKFVRHFFTFDTPQQPSIFHVMKVTTKANYLLKWDPWLPGIFDAYMDGGFLW